MDDSNLPLLNQITSRLAADNQRVTRFVRSLPDQVQELISAATQNDWAEVRRLGDFLAISSEAYGMCEIGKSARQLSEACDGDQRHEARRRLLKLIGTIP